MSFFCAAARVRRFPRMPLLHTARSCVSITLSFNFAMYSSTHSSHVFLVLPWWLCPLHFQILYVCMLSVYTKSSDCLHSICPNHLNLPRLTTSETHSMSSRLDSSALAFLSLSFTPHIHLIIILSVISSRCIRLPSSPTSRCHTPSRSGHRYGKLFFSSSVCPPSRKVRVTKTFPMHILLSY